MKKTGIAAAVLLLVIALVAFGRLGGDGGNQAGTDAGSEGQTQTASGAKHLNFGCQMYSDGNINTARDENGGWNVTRFGVGECLFKFNDNMEIEEWLADGYTVNDEHTEWVITLKKGVKFSDGCDLTPSRVKAYFEHLKKMGASGSAKPEKFLEFEAQVTADDEANTLTIVTSKPYANLIGQLAHPTMAILDVEHTTNYDNGSIGTGPYMVESFKGVGVGYEMAANPYYREKVPYDTITIMFMGDASAKTMALQSGQVDLVENITNVADIQKFQEDPNFTVDIAAGVRIGFSWMNFNGILANKTLRQAILMGIDYKTICESKTIGGLYIPGFSVLPSTLPYGYENLNNPYEYDPEAAKKLLDDAGIVDTNGDGLRELNDKNIDLRYVSYENRLLNDFSSAHIQYLKDIGIGCTADFGSSDDQWNKLVAGEYDFNNNNWLTVKTGDPYEFMFNWKTGAGYCGYSNQEYDKLYEQLAGEMDVNKRKEIIFRLQQILVDDAVAVIDGYYSSSMIYSKNVAEAHINTIDFYWLSTGIIPAE